MSIGDLMKIGLEDLEACFDIKENFYEKYLENEILKNKLLLPLMKQRDCGTFNWVDETPLGGMGTTLNACVLYSLIRHHKIKHVIETGVSGGYYSSFMLAALNENNNEGLLTSLEISDNKQEVGKFVPKFQLNDGVNWDLRMGRSSLEYFSDCKKDKVKHNAVLYSHDSLHTMAHMLKELKEFKESTSDVFYVFIDDEKSDRFWERCLEAGFFKKQGYEVKYVSGAESRLRGHLGGFVQYRSNK
jgi:hypothetical protein